MSNPVVQVNLTERELTVLAAKLGWGSRYPTLRDKLSAAREDMKQAKRLKNRENKIARKAREDKVGNV